MSVTLTALREASSTVDEDVANGVAEYLQQIRAIRDTEIGAIFRLGKVLNEAKARLPHGAWQDLARQLPFSLRHAHRVRVIAAHPILANSDTWSDLPDGPAILYALARLDGDVIRAAITAGQVHPRMTLADARTLAGGARAEKKAGTVESVIQQFERVCLSVPLSDRPLLVAPLQGLVDRLLLLWHPDRSRRVRARRARGALRRLDRESVPDAPAEAPDGPRDPEAKPVESAEPVPTMTTAEDEVLRRYMTPVPCSRCRRERSPWLVSDRGCPECLDDDAPADAPAPAAALVPA